MTYLLALDQGTSSSRSIVFDETGRTVAMAQLELPQIYPQPGWVEHDVLEIWRIQLATARDALSKAGIPASAVKSLGITNQRETTVVWNRKTGQPIHNAIVWQDRRAEPLCADLRARGLTDTIQAKTGLLVDAYFSGTKLNWLLDHVPGARAAAEAGAGRAGFSSRIPKSNAASPEGTADAAVRDAGRSTGASSKSRIGSGSSSRNSASGGRSSRFFRLK